MNDQLENYYEEPRKEFGRELYERLTREERKPRRWQSAAAAAAIMITVLLGFVAAGIPKSSSPLAQPTPIPLNVLAPITVENAAQLTKVMTLGNGAINNAVWSPDGRTIAVATSRGLYLHDSGDLSAAPRLLGNQEEAVASIVYDAEGTRIAGIRDGSIQVWDAQTGEVLHRIETDNEAFSVLGLKDQQVASQYCTKQDPITGCTEMNIFFWDLTTGEQTLTFEKTWFRAPRLSRDWSVMVYSRETMDEAPKPSEVTLHIVDLASGEETAVISADWYAHYFELSQDGSLLFIPSVAGPSYVYSVASLAATAPDLPEPVATLRHALFAPESVFHPDNETIFITGAENNAFFDLESGERIHRLTTRAELHNARFSPNGETLMMIGPGSLIRLWDTQSGDVVQKLEKYEPFYTSTAFSPDDRLLALNSWGGNIHLWNIEEPPFVQAIVRSEVSDDHSTIDGQFSPDGEQLLYRETRGYGYNTINTLKIGSGKIEQSLSLPDFQTNGYEFEFAPDGSVLRLLSESGVVGKPFEEKIFFIRLENNPELRHFNSVVYDFSPDGRLLAALNCIQKTQDDLSCLHGEINIWQVDTGKFLRRMAGVTVHGSAPLTFSPDGKFLASSQCETITEQSNVFGVFIPRCEGVYLSIWDVSEVYDQQTTIPTPLEPIVSIEGFEFTNVGITFNSLSTDERLLLATNENGNLRLWNVETATREHNELVNTEVNPNSFNVEFSHNGKMIAIASHGFVELWGVPMR